MFCRFCGKKIEQVGEPCPHCNKTQGELQSTDGFFGILSVCESKATDSDVVNMTSVTRNIEASAIDATTKKEVERVRESQRKLSKKVDKLNIWILIQSLVLLVALALIIVLFILFNGKIGKLQDEVDSLGGKVKVIENSLNEVQNNIKNSNMSSDAVEDVESDEDVTDGNEDDVTSEDPTEGEEPVTEDSEEDPVEGEEPVDEDVTEPEDPEEEPVDKDVTDPEDSEAEPEEEYTDPEEELVEEEIDPEEEPEEEDADPEEEPEEEFVDPEEEPEEEDANPEEENEE